MRIALMSDFHLGFAQAERENDAFENAKKAVELAIKENVDLILISGDIFHEEEPNASALLQAIEIFSLAKNAKSEKTKVVKVKNGEKREFLLAGIPIIAIHGTHEFRGRDYINYLQLFESAGFIVYLHAAKAIYEKQGEKIVIHGLGGVPEKKACDVLKLWNPKPESNAFNILMLHQSLKELLPFEDEMVASLSIADLPEGFDLIVNGHLHWQNVFKENNKFLVIPGSTVITQMKRLEAKKAKGLYIIDTKTLALNFLELPEQRKFFYYKLEFENASCEEVVKRVSELLSELLSKDFNKKPLVKIKLTGSLAKGYSQENLELETLLEKFKEKAIVSIDADFVHEQFEKKFAMLSDMQKEKKSLIELGFELLEKNLAETNFNNAFDIRRIFRLLENGDVERARELLMERKQVNKKEEPIKENAEEKCASTGKKVKLSDFV